MAQQGQGFDFEKRPTERPHPAHYLKKREGSPGGLKQPPATRSASPGARIPAHHGGASPGATAAAPFKVSGSTLFRKRYDRGELPVRVDQGRPGRNGLRWTADLASLDLHLYLPIFVEGLQETQEPFRMLARQGVQELLEGSPPERVLPVIPQLIMGLRAALKSADGEVVQAGLRALRALLDSCEGAGPAIVPYYRQLLPPMARYVDETARPGGSTVDCGQAPRAGSLADQVGACLEALERSGGPDAFLNIKYHVPCYQSALRPARLTRKA